MSQSHDELQALAAGFALGALDPDDLQKFEAHLNECPECAAEVRSLVGAVDALGRSIPQQTPPPELKQRVMASIREAAAPSRVKLTAVHRLGWLPIAALLLLALGSGIYGSHLHVESRLAALSLRAEANDREIAAANRAATESRRATRVIAAPDVVRIDLKGENITMTGTARALWSRQHGMVFAATNIPAVPPDRCYQIWLVSDRATISAGILPKTGDGLAVFDTPQDIPQPHGAAVTLEPAGGSAVPTGTKVLVGNLP